MNAQITAIINQKGGVGKTTSTVNLGVGLAREGKKVLLVDADPQGSLSISMGLQNPDEISDTLSTLMLAEMEYRPIYPDHGIIHHKEGVDLLPGNIELSGVELSLFNTMSRELVLRNVLDRLRCNYSFTYETGAGCPEEVISGKIQITKKIVNTVDNLSAAETGAKFSVTDRNGTVVVTIVTGDNGVGISKALPYGTYTVKQIWLAAMNKGQIYSNRRDRLRKTSS